MENVELKNRKQLANFLDKINAKVVVEVGVREGYFSKYILDNSKIEKLYAVDPWEKNAELENGAEEAFNTCKNLFEPYGHRAEMVKGYSPSAAEMFDDNSLDFVYIDGLHDYDSVKADIEGWYPKLKIGGIISGHDYHKEDWPGVVNSVNEFVEENGLQLNVTGVEGIDFSDTCHDGAKASWWAYKK